MAQVGTCVACEVTNVRVATATAECACQVCEHCAELFMADGACGVCGAALSTDDLEEDDDASASGRVGPMVGDMDKRGVAEAPLFAQAWRQRPARASS